MTITTRTTRAGLAALAATGVLAAAPVAADAHGGDRGGQEAVPTRVSKKLRSVSRALDRAEGYAEDGEGAKAITALTSARRNLASAQRTGLRRIAAESDSAPATASALERAEHTS